MSKTPEDIQVLLKSVLDEFDKEDQDIREAQILKVKKLKLYWDGIHNFFYSEVAHDWRIWNHQQVSQDDTADYYDKPVNVYRAYLESIIAALSVTIPAIKCMPDDADNPNDVSTAKAGDRIAQLVFKHNDMILVFIHALFLYCTEGMIAAYNYSKSDKKYGTYKEKQFEEYTDEKYVCPNCQAELTEDMLGMSMQNIDPSLAPEPNQSDMMGGVPETNPQANIQSFNADVRDEFNPSDEDADLHEAVLDDQPVCPECGVQLDLSLQKTPFIVTRLVNETEKAKARQQIETYGLLNVKVPNYTRRQADFPYLIYSYEKHWTSVIEEYPELTDRDIRNLEAGGISHDSYERWGRTAPEYNGTDPDSVVTCRHAWLRPSAFNVLDDDQANKLKKRYPDGCQVIFINEIFAHACNESMDDHWTITRNPLSDSVHYQPLGLLAVSIQDITNDLVSLIIQTIEHGIPQTFADPAVLNFEQYRNTEVTPGAVFPTKQMPSGKAVSDGFYEIKTSTLSAEVLPFVQKIQEFGQLVTGALPSLFGGDIQGSKTASQYSMSRAQALQRLQTPWKMLTIWWKEIFSKVIPQYIKDVVEDEKFVSRDNYGNYINTWIRRAELQGKIGDIELEASEQLPTTWAQQRDVLMQLLQAGNPMVMEGLTAPENLHQLAQSIGLTGFQIPGEADRQKQYEEIQLLLMSGPIMDPMTGMEQPSVMPDPMIDDNQIEYDVTRDWLIGEAGRLAKIENPEGYKNVLLHCKAHMDIMVMGQQAAAIGPVEQDPGMAMMGGATGMPAQGGKNGASNKKVTGAQAAPQNQAAAAQPKSPNGAPDARTIQ
jgi:rubredoxin